MPDPELTTARLVLKPVTPRDLENLHAMFADPEGMRYMPSPPHTDPQQTIDYVQAQMQPADAHFWTIFGKGNPEPLGLVNFLGNTSLPGLGYHLKSVAWGKGIAAEAGRAVLKYGFETLGFERVELWIDARNRASQRVASKLGFLLRSRLPFKYPHDDEEHLHLIYGLSRAEWRGEEEEIPVYFHRAEYVLEVTDVKETAEYYRDVLGFRIDFYYGSPPNHAAVTRGKWTATGVTLQIARRADATYAAGSGYLYIFVDSRIDELHAELLAKGVDIQRDPITYPWGLREFEIRDLNGFRIRFGTHA